MEWMGFGQSQIGEETRQYHPEMAALSIEERMEMGITGRKM